MRKERKLTTPSITMAGQSTTMLTGKANVSIWNQDQVMRWACSVKSGVPTASVKTIRKTIKAAAVAAKETNAPRACFRGPSQRVMTILKKKAPTQRVGTSQAKSMRSPVLLTR